MTRILIVEDSRTQAEGLRALLEANGYEAVVTRNGQEALADLRQTLPDLIVTDIMMPEMDGFELCGVVKADPQLRAVPVAILTSLADPSDIVSGLEAGADSFITKPYDVEELLEHIRELLARPRAAAADVEALEFEFQGKTRRITLDRMQILDLLLGTYQTAVSKNRDLQRARGELQALTQSLEHKVAERTRALNEYADEVRDLYNNAPVGYHSLDADGVFVRINDTLLSWLGYTREELVGKRAFAELLTPHSQFHFQATFATFKLRGWVKDVEYELVRRDGSTLPVLVSATSVEDADGHFLMSRTTVWDMTEQKRAQAEKASLQAQLQQAQKMEDMGRLAGGVAHDFNNLLTGIIGFSEFLLASMPADDPRRGDVEEIQKAGEQAAGLTQQLLAFSRKQVLKPRIHDLNDVVAAMQKLLRRLVNADVELELVLHPEALHVLADRGHIEQVVMNLAVNATDAMPNGGRITLQTTRLVVREPHPELTPGRWVVLSVADTGEGIHPDVKARMFDPFFTTKEIGKGTGLGLSTVYGIVTQSGGHITVDSEPGHGATFKVFLPEVETAADAPSSQHTASGPQRGTETILVVDDDDAVRKFIRRTLAENGYEVLEAAVPTEALEVCERRADIHLVITDMVMPQMNGFELAQRAANILPEVKQIFMSGYSDKLHVDFDATSLHHAFLGKPVATAALLHKVREVLGTS